MTLRPIGTEVLFCDDPYIYKVMGHTSTTELHLPEDQRTLLPTHERIEAIGKLQEGKKQYFDGRVEPLENWQI